MSTIAKLAVDLIANIANYEENFAKAHSTAAKFSENIQKIGQGISDVGGKLTAGVTLPIAGAFAYATSKASDLNEVVSKVNVVFGDSAKGILDWSNTSATAMGVSKQQALDAAGTFGNLFVSMNMTKDKSAQMSQSIVTLASDLASFNNLDPGEVLEKLRAGLTGESEPLKSLGVNINEATIKAKAMQMGLTQTSVDMVKVNGATLKLSEANAKAAEEMRKHGENSLQYRNAAQNVAEAQQAVEKAMAGSTVELTAAQKAQAVYALVMEQTKTAQGDFARTSDGLANTQRIVKAQFDDAAASIGDLLLPYALQLANGIRDLLTQFNGLDTGTKQTIVTVLALVAGLGPLLLVVGNVVSGIGAIVPIVTTVAGVLGGPLLVPIAGVIAFLVLLYTAWTNNWGGIQQKTQQAIDFVGGLLRQFTAFANAHTAELNGILQAGYNIIMGMMKVTWGIITGDWKLSLEGLKQIAQGAFDFVTNVIALAMGKSQADVKRELFAIADWFFMKWNGIKTFISTFSLEDAATNVLMSLANALKAGAYYVVNALVDVLNSAIAAAKHALGIASPSTVGAGWGENLMSSFADSINEFGGLPKVELSAALGGVTNAGNRATQSAPGGSGGRVAYLTLNFNGNTDSRAARDGTMEALRAAGLSVIG